MAGIDWKVQIMMEDFSVGRQNSEKCSGNCGLDTSANGCPTPLGFRKRVVYSSLYSRLRWSYPDVRPMGYTYLRLARIQMAQIAR